MPTNEIETIIDRLDAAQFDVSLLLLHARQALRQAQASMADAEARAEAARAQVAEVTAECDRLRSFLNVNQCGAEHMGAVEWPTDASPVPTENNPKP